MRAPIQEFTPLLIEHDARDTIREQGFRPDLSDEDDDAPAHDTEGHHESPALHLSAQHGLALPEPD